MRAGVPETAASPNPLARKMDRWIRAVAATRGRRRGSAAEYGLPFFTAAPPRATGCTSLACPAASGPEPGPVDHPVLGRLLPDRGQWVSDTTADRDFTVRVTAGPREPDPGLVAAAVDAVGKIDELVEEARGHVDDGLTFCELEVSCSHRASASDSPYVTIRFSIPERLDVVDVDFQDGSVVDADRP